MRYKDVGVDDVVNAPTRASAQPLSGESFFQPLSRLQKIMNIIMKKPYKSITTFAACCLVLIATYLTVGSMLPGNVAFADVCAIIQKAKTMVCTAKTNPSHPDLNTNMDIKIMSIAPGKIRQEIGSLQVMITDYSVGKTLTLNLQNKTAKIINIKGAPKSLQQIGFIQLGGFMLYDWFTSIKNISQNSDAEDLGLQTINGKEVKVFRIKTEDYSVTFWVEPKTGNPIKVECQIKIPDVTDKDSKGEKTMGVSMVLSNFQLDVPLDESLFSLTPPEGYNLQSETNLDFSNPGEKDMIEVLRRYANIENGVFPGSLTDLNILIKFPSEARRQIEKKIKTPVDKKATEKKLKDVFQEAMNVCCRMSLFLEQNKGWKYVGKGVKLGDAQTPIFWYVPKDAKQGRVIYGDLSVRDVPLDQMPPDPEPQKGNIK
jgi:outer membrane lipoprotein-sorting protein